MQLCLSRHEGCRLNRRSARRCAAQRGHTPNASAALSSVKALALRCRPPPTIARCACPVLPRPDVSGLLPVVNVEVSAHTRIQVPDQRGRAAKFIDAAVRAWFTIELVAGRARCERVRGLFYASSPMGLGALLRITGCDQNRQATPARVSALQTRPFDLAHSRQRVNHRESRG